MINKELRGTHTQEKNISKTKPVNWKHNVLNSMRGSRGTTKSFRKFIVSSHAFLRHTLGEGV